MLAMPGCSARARGSFHSGWPVRRGFLPVTVFFICAACAFASGQRQRAPLAPQPLDLPSYNRRIEGWVTSLGALKSHPGQAAALRRRLAPEWIVQAGSRRINVPMEWLGSGLDSLDSNPKSATKTTEDLIARLQAMKQEANRAGAVSQHIDLVAREDLKEVLALREFRGIHGPTWFDQTSFRVRRWLSKWLLRLNLTAASHPGITNFIFWAVLIVGGCCLFIWMLQELLHSPGAKRVRLSAPGGPAAISWKEMLDSAQKSAAAGDYREAIRLAYGVAIRSLGDAGLWTVDDARTHREYLRMVRRDQPQREPMTALTRQFELIWYAGAASSATDFESAMAQLEKLGCA